MPALSGGSLAIADRDFFVGARGISTQARRGGGSIAACARFVQQRSKNHCINILDGAQFGDENTRPFPDPKSGEAVAERAEERRVGKECVSTCRSWGSR